MTNCFLSCTIKQRRTSGQNFDLRTTPEDTSQRMLNALERGTHVPIHRHLKTSETVICLEGCLDEIFYEEDADSLGGPGTPSRCMSPALFWKLRMGRMGNKHTESTDNTERLRQR